MRATLLAVSLLLAGCPPKAVGTPPESFCPGSPGCEHGADGTFQVGMAIVDVTPKAFERANPDYFMVSADACPEQTAHGKDGQARCGALDKRAFRDCGLDAKCPDDPGYVQPDADGTEHDGKPDWFFDCGRDGKCPGAAGYTGLDADGSEGDGKFQGFWLAGFDANRPMDSVHDPMQARALVMQNGDVTIAMVAVDAVGLFRDDVVRIRDLVAKKVAAPGIDFVLVSSTHSHEMPDTLGQWGLTEGIVPTRGVDDAWLKDVLVEGVAQSVADAFTAKRPATIRAVQTNLGDITRQVISDLRDPFVSDDMVTVLAFTEKASGEPIGSVVSWADHPETLFDTNNAASADFIWAVREDMEKGLFQGDGTRMMPGFGGINLYLSGSVGGMMSSLEAHPTTLDGAPTRDATFAKARAIGDHVAKIALEGLAQAHEMPAPPLAYGTQTLKLRVDNEVFQLVFGNLSVLKRRIYDYDTQKPISEANLPHILTEIGKIQVGGIRFLAVPGELLPELAVGYDKYYAFGNPQIKPTNPNPPDLSKAPAGPYLRELTGGDISCVIGLANDEIGYIVPSYDFKVSEDHAYIDAAPGDHYEETNSLGPATTPTLLEAYGKLLSWNPTP